jgi:hypothetical protein
MAYRPGYVVDLDSRLLCECEMKYADMSPPAPPENSLHQSQTPVYVGDIYVEK